jgi:hypothetical protein
MDALGITEERLKELNDKVIEFLDKSENFTPTSIFAHVAEITETAEEYTYFIYKVGKTDGLADSIKLLHKRDKKPTNWE